MRLSGKPYIYNTTFSEEESKCRLCVQDPLLFRGGNIQRLQGDCCRHEHGGAGK
jgi:hypothetical protein